MGSALQVIVIYNIMFLLNWLFTDNNTPVSRVGTPKAFDVAEHITSNTNCTCAQ